MAGLPLVRCWEEVNAVVIMALRWKALRFFKYIGVCGEQCLQQVILRLDGTQVGCLATVANEAHRLTVVEKHHGEGREIPYNRP
jgi:hypothetical protein